MKSQAVNSVQFTDLPLLPALFRTHSRSISIGLWQWYTSHWHKIRFWDSVHRLIFNKPRRFGIRLCFRLQTRKALPVVNPRLRRALRGSPEQAVSLSKDESRAGFRNVVLHYKLYDVQKPPPPTPQKKIISANTQPMLVTWNWRPNFTIHKTRQCFLHFKLKSVHVTRDTDKIHPGTNIL